MSLHAIGWNEHLETAFTSLGTPGLRPARVLREDRGRFLLASDDGDVPGVVAGKLRHEATSKAALPAVGDWVAVRPGRPAVIVHVLPRSGVFVRKAAGETTEEQVIAANVDVAFLMSGLDHDLNLRRIERFLAAAWESGAVPVVVLNKADLIGDLDARVAEVQAVALGVPVIAIAAAEHRGLEALGPWLAPGSTVALLGSSGVGKSTLVNALLGAERQAIGAVREHDQRGRHTTTHRELVSLPGGAVLLDTPGLRELALWADEETLGETFPDVAALASECRFRDCRHAGEPGCAVTSAAASGRLDPARLASWRKLQRELRWLEVQKDGRARAEEQAKWKRIHKAMKHHPKADRWR